ncbi:NAD(P)H-binding protein [Glycomyces sp. TRM65418]|uniref:NAD(P)H-binding protein n=1 Tax=Glycomyces sp. TRM65418 TaxID=2867006 RepID=UPI001CE67E2E|nr:NAD(P)H-binding protein [Glycomyces sp. TRM65418]MCC3765057.1 NAD(P)H-binding protein [Glycomyces sp. TRM65418]QZD54687.1 NAD(P)H-binding protein [Glycomyces sp. TRM65418]
MIVVTGATGNVGRPLVETLAAAGKPVTAVSRGEAVFPPGVAHRRADLAEPSSLKPAFEGAEALFLLIRDQELEVRPVVDAAVDAGIGRIVLLSSELAATRSDESQRAFEAVVVDSGLAWTILRPGGFASNALLWAESVRLHRTVTAPFGDVGLPVIDPLDIAEVAAAALTGDDHAGRAYLLSGPALVTPREQTAAIAAAIGEPVSFVEQSRAEAREQFLQFWPAEVVDASLAVIGTPNEAEQEVTGEVERVLGRPATPFKEWAKRNADAFR